MANTYKALSTVTVGAGGAASIDFTNIPQTYTDFKIVLSARTNYAGTNDYAGIAINGNSSNLSNRFLWAVNGTSVSSSSYPSPANKIQGTINAASSTATIFGNFELYIPNYINSSNKALSVDSVTENNAISQGESWLNAGLWSNTAPITSVSITPYYGTLFNQYTTATLYGVFNADVSSAPATPTIGTATAGNAQASITFTPVSNAASYTMTSTPGSITATGTSSPIVVTGLTNETAYTFKVKSNNPFGSSAESAASNSVTPSVGVLDSIATFTVGAGGASSVEFTSIPSTYSHLQVRLLVRTNRATYNSDSLYMQYNSDSTGANYAYHALLANNNNFPGTVISFGSSNNLGEMYISANNGNAPFAGYVVDILDYANTSKFKTSRAVGGADSNGDVASFCTVPMLTSQVWKNTNAITSIKFLPVYGTSFNQYTQFALYGIRSS